MVNLKITRLVGESEEAALIPSIIRRHAVELIDPRGDLFRSADGVEFGLTPDWLEVFDSVPNADFAEMQHVLYSIGWRKAQVCGTPEWVRKVLSYPGSVDLVVEEESADTGIEFEPVGVDRKDRMVLIEDLPAMPCMPEASVETENGNALQSTGSDSDEAETIGGHLPSPAVFERVSPRSEPVWASCEMNVKGLVSVRDEPELVEAIVCIGRYLARVGYPAEVLPQVYMSIQNGGLNEFNASFALPKTSL